MDRADNYAHDVSNIVLALAGAVVLFRDPGTELLAATYAGNVTNAIWVFIGGSRFAISYAHETGMIELRENSLHGPTITSFNDTNSIESIRAVFESL